jgi:hypothetical protein
VLSIVVCLSGLGPPPNRGKPGKKVGEGGHGIDVIYDFYELNLNFQ